MRAGEHQWWSGALGRDVVWAFTLSAAMYAVPCTALFPPFPLAMLAALLPKELFDLWEADLSSMLLPLGFVLAWNIALAALHFWRLRSRPLTGRLLLAPIVVLTSGPLYWVVWTKGPPTPEEIVQQRQPELGDWEEVCRLEGAYAMAPTARAALDAGQAWIAEGKDRYRPYRVARLRVESACSLTYADIPAGTRLFVGHLGERAAYVVEHTLYLRDEDGRASALSTHGRVDEAVFSDDAEWLAWTSDPNPKDHDNPYELSVQRVGGANNWSTRLQLAPAAPYPSTLLAYDPLAQEATLELSTRALARVDSTGRILSQTAQPEDCRHRRPGSWLVHAAGWAYLGVRDCHLIWDLNRHKGKLDLQSPFRSAGVRSISISPDGERLAYSSDVLVGSHSISPVSATVVRTEDGSEIARIHLQPLKWAERASIAFLGEEHLLLSETGLVRLIRLRL